MKSMQAKLTRQIAWWGSGSIVALSALWVILGPGQTFAVSLVLLLGIQIALLVKIFMTYVDAKVAHARYLEDRFHQAVFQGEARYMVFQVEQSLRENQKHGF